jgi:hypothetical protein
MGNETVSKIVRSRDGDFLLLRPYHGEHGPKVPVTPEYIVLQRMLGGCCENGNVCQS